MWIKLKYSWYNLSLYKKIITYNSNGRYYIKLDDEDIWYNEEKWAKEDWYRIEAMLESQYSYEGGNSDD